MNSAGTPTGGFSHFNQSNALLFAAMTPVDTHIWRVTRRLGWIPPKASQEQAHIMLEELVPPELYYALHLNLIAHGRAICQARRPRCEVCPLKAECEYYGEMQS